MSQYPLFDLSVVNAVQSSLKNSGKSDPWGRKLAGSLANIIAYSDGARFPLPYIGSKAISTSDVEEPNLIRLLDKALPGFFVPIPYSTDDGRDLSVGEKQNVFETFLKRVEHKPENTRRFLDVQFEPWVQRDQRFVRTSMGSRYEVNDLLCHKRLKDVASNIAILPERLLYAFDLVLRYPAYGFLTGQEQHYLNHPIRNMYASPSVSEQEGRKPNIAVSFAHELEKIHGTLTADEYVETVVKLRNAVDEYDLRHRSSGSIDREELKQIAASADLRPNLAKLPKLATAVTGGVISGSISLVLTNSPNLSIIAGSAVGIASNAWEDLPLPRKMGQVKWLRWATKYSIEEMG